MSQYATITSLAESPVAAGVIYVGTDDGLLHVTDDGGETWREMARPDGLPDVAFVNDVEPSQHDADTVFLAADDHKSGDFTPYLFESNDRGRNWRSIRGDLPGDTIVWVVEQDHEHPGLLFIGAERGVHVTLDGGEHWHRLTKDMPTIAVRDLAIQRRDDDLVVGTFGRGIYVLDDYGPLRTLADQVDEPVSLSPVRDAWWYVPYRPMQADGQPTLGSTAFRTPNPEFGVTFTYHLADDIETSKEARRATERAAAEAGNDIDFPGWDRLRAERLESAPAFALRVSDADGQVVRLLAAETTAGLHRTTWDLRMPPPDPVSLEPEGFRAPWDRPPKGDLAPPGRYTVDVVRLDGDDAPEVLTGPESFEVRPVPAAVGGDADDPEFRRATADLARRVRGAAKAVDRLQERLKHLRAAAVQTPGAGAANATARIDAAARSVDDLSTRLTGDADRKRLEESTVPGIRDLVDRVVRLHGETTGPPSQTQRDVVDRAATEFETFENDLATTTAEVDAITESLDAAGAPWTPRG